MTLPTQPDPPPTRKIAIAAGSSLLVAALILVTTILPAEFGMDPLGTGRALGLLALSSTVPSTKEDSRSSASETGLYKTESTEFKLRRGEGFEFKYRLAKGGGLLYAWTATGKVKYEFHGEAEGGPSAGLVLSYEKDERDRSSGSLIAPFAGIHGWYWENAGDDELAITLRSAGFYTAGVEFRSRFNAEKHKNFVEQREHELMEVK